MVKILLASLTLGFLAEAASSVTGVTVKQRWPWNNLVDIEYALTVDEGKMCSLTFKGYNGSEEITPFASLTGDGVGAYMDSSGTYHALWDSSADGFATATKKLKVSIGVTEEELKTYYIKVDLTSGAITEEVAAPATWTTDDKTKYLWLRRIPATAKAEVPSLSGDYFVMGSPTGELGRESDETQHNVTLTKDFYIGVFELTEAQYNYITNSIAPGTSTTAKNRISYDDLRGAYSGAGWPASTDVDSTSIIGKLRTLTSGKTPSGYRFDLPTEAQWEYACRGPKGWGSTWNDGSKILSDTGEDSNLDKLGWYDKNSSSVQAVGQKTPNDWGLYDMHGNVWEWCLDWDSNYASGAVENPVGSASGFYRVYRGGSCGGNASYCRSAYRNAYLPVYDIDCGARVALVQ